MKEQFRIDDDQLKDINGGAGVTRWGFKYDDQGTVDFKGLKINAADWKWLIGQYNGNIGDPEYYISMLSAQDVEKILYEHHPGVR